MACNYRERELLKLNPEECRNVERKGGLVLSIDALVDGVWQLWSGNASSTLVHGQLREDAGKTVFELWKTTYSAMIIRNLKNKKEMIINGNNGQMFRNQSGRVVGRYSNKGYDGKFHYSPKYYAVWDADKPIWELVISFT